MGRLLSKLFGQLSQGRGAEDAAAAFAQHTALAYYDHLRARLLTRSTHANDAPVDVLLEVHMPWEEYFARQHEHAAAAAAADGSTASGRLGRRLLALIAASPPPPEAADLQAEAHLQRFDGLLAPLDQKEEL